MSWQALAATLVLIGFVALCLAALIPDPEEAQRVRELAESRRRKLERDQLDRAEAMKIDGTHLYKKPIYKPAAAYLAPAKPEPPTPSNVAPIRRAKR